MEPEIITRWVTCETPECPSSGAPIKMQYPEDVSAVVCGACSKPITDITDIKPKEGTVLPEWISEMLQTQNSDA